MMEKFTPSHLKAPPAAPRLGGGRWGCVGEFTRVLTLHYTLSMLNFSLSVWKKNLRPRYAAEEVDAKGNFFV
jgi:hypothetical protein